jgi:hydroxyethylthiazole kinase-like uncharacterized protein yjeF
MEAARRLPVLSCAEAAAAEAAFIGTDKKLSWQLMRCASLGVAHEALTLLRRQPKRILILAGQGNNGADAFLAALYCAQPGTEMTVVFAGRRPTGAQALRAWSTKKRGVKIKYAAAAKLPDLGRVKFCLIFDGIFGQGFHGPLSKDLGALLRNTEKLQGLRIAVDLPSGLGDDTRGPAFRADLTVSIGCLKRPLLEPSARKFTGRIRVLDIGLPLGETEEVSATEETLAPLRQIRRADADKRHQGRVLIIGGSETMPGAVLMNTRAALQSGAGLVTTCLPKSLRNKAALALPEAMWNPFATGTSGYISADALPSLRKSFPNKDVLLLGSGMGEKSAATLVKLVKRCDLSLVLDADALRPEIIQASAPTKIRVLLPHAGEFKRLSGHTMTPSAGRAYAKQTKTIVVLKGALTCVTDGVRTLHIPFGGPVLARGGSGDLLAGMVASVLARRTELKLTPLEAVELAVVWQGCAADILSRKQGEEAVRNTDLLSEIYSALLS